MIYLDHAASTPTHFFAAKYSNYWANPNSPHALGLEANQALTEAKDRIKKVLGVNSGVVLFCRCATEAVEWLCKELGRYRTLRGNILCSEYEHDSVVDNCFSALNQEDLKMLNSERILIYLHQYVNHITGTAFNIESIGK